MTYIDMASRCFLVDVRTELHILSFGTLHRNARVEGGLKFTKLVSEASAETAY